MRIQIHPSQVNIWLSTYDTYAWAHKPGAYWPCSQLSGKRVLAVFDRNGLADFALNGRSADCDANELSAICADHLKGKLPESHPCFDVACGQFLNA